MRPWPNRDLLVAVSGLRSRDMEPGPISSPCIKVCAVSGQTGLCIGCGRTLAEIASWASMDEDRRRAIMAELRARLERAL